MRSDAAFLQLWKGSHSSGSPAAAAGIGGGGSIVGRPAGRCAGVYHNPGDAEIILEKI